MSVGQENTIQHASFFSVKTKQRQRVGRRLASAREATSLSVDSSGESKTMDARMVTAFETSVELLARSAEKKARSEEKEKNAEREMIKAMLNECGERMTPEEKKRWSRKLMAMYVKDIQSNGASQGEGGGGL